MKIHYSSLGVVDSLDVKYTLGNSTDTNIETDLVKPHVELDRGRRSRRSRDFLKVGDDPVAAKSKKSQKVVELACDDVSDSEALNKENHYDHFASMKKKSVPAKKRKKPRPEGPRPEPTKKRKNKPLKAARTNVVTEKGSKHDNQDAATDDSNDIPKYIITKGSESVGPISPLVAGTGATEGNESVCNTITQNHRSVSEEDDTCSKSRVASSLVAVPVSQDVTEYETHKTLKTVYDGHVREATNYINSLVGPPQSQIQKTFSPPPAKTAAQRAEDE